MTSVLNLKKATTSTSMKTFFSNLNSKLTVNICMIKLRKYISVRLSELLIIIIKSIKKIIVLLTI